MNPTVTIKSIKNRHILSDAGFEYVLENIGKPLQLSAVWFDRKGQLVHFAVYFGDTVVALFGGNVIEGEFSNGIKFQLG